ncbi:hypothetical protein KNV09_gp112 [Vibrio phage Athena]|uniref:Uncharacterized protein n=6 Tax=Thalassavirus TaxID=2948922 RepID=A0A6M4EUQ2_9CAUD|nr:hypothetical protein KNU52_gp094 [Vibrio phage Achelous]YP_010102608.1 hypothetical protein KNU58_gp097 [Vibrio phage Brizo]YP_010105770.1 hypothetical protein KNU87_gp109 [Vibrio phage Bennett]YP_010105960.1 hypothetical protein KNU88_gp112 [Vibrio phage Chester]YP_010108410.1 hypothetical protein KNV07_gp112 [Vibrio phage Cody]YP_010108798.1 hypothetical protein KNV09_gp112 [Vibrio phage Athena]QIG66295.1 hypothetical protein CILSICK_196 [Vibrio phage Cilsick]QIG66488.1 hypothetical pro
MAYKTILRLHLRVLKWLRVIAIDEEDQLAIEHEIADTLRKIAAI